MISSQTTAIRVKSQGTCFVSFISKYILLFLRQAVGRRYKRLVFR